MNRYDAMFLSSIFFLFLSARTSNPFFAIFAILVVLTFTFVRVWRWYLYKHITASIKMDTHRVFPGEQITGELIIENRGLVPIFGLRVSFDYWEQFKLESDYLQIDEKGTTGVFKKYQGTFNMGGREIRRIPIRLVGEQRGTYVFKGIHLLAADPLGLDKMEKDIYFYEEILVYPQEIELQGFSKTHRMPQGESVVQRWVHDDIFFPVGARPYQATDPFHRIDFKVSAKLQQLHTKQFDFTAHGDICVVANLLTTDNSWSNDNELFERILSIVARIARESLRKDLRLSFITNAQMGKGTRSFEIPSSSGKKHYRKILEVLARFSYFHVTPFSIALSKVQQRYSNGAQVVIVTAFLDERTTRELNLMLKQGFDVYRINPEEEYPTIIPWTFSSGKKKVV